ncbi:MAG: hypothetical protein HOV83_05975 [Catenulispora sp.]|nr:hypothetical protein [Catenulispora sp.]
MAVGVALVLDLRGIAAGAVPGGVPIYAATLGLALFLAGLGGVTVAEVGCGSGWGAGLTAAWRQPGRSTTAAGIVAVAAILAWAVPVTLPIVGAVALYALHATRIRARHHLDVRR